jgi:hypothetical protein
MLQNNLKYCLNEKERKIKYFILNVIYISIFFAKQKQSLHLNFLIQIETILLFLALVF